MHVEPEFEAFLRRLVPGCEQHWEGATEDEIEDIEDFAERPLPPFYRWLLSRMGRSMGPLANPRRDLSAAAVLTTYEEFYTPPRAGLLLIANESDEVMPTSVFYDLARRTRDDALVCSGHPHGGGLQLEFETLREMLAWGMALRFAVGASAQRCRGSFTDASRDVLTKLEPALAGLGFTEPITTGPFCAVFEHPSAAMVAMAPPAEDKPPYVFFQLGADGEPMIRRILGAVTTETSLEMEIRRWTPPLRPLR